MLRKDQNSVQLGGLTLAEYNIVEMKRVDDIVRKHDYQFNEHLSHI